MTIKKRKIISKIKCPNCKELITKEDLRYAQMGTMFYKVWFDDNGEPNYEEDEFETDDGGEFFHANCGGEAIAYDDLKKLGVNY